MYPVVIILPHKVISDIKAHLRYDYMLIILCMCWIKLIQETFHTSFKWIDQCICSDLEINLFWHLFVYRLYTKVLIFVTYPVAQFFKRTIQELAASPVERHISPLDVQHSWPNDVCFMSTQYFEYFVHAPLCIIVFVWLSRKKPQTQLLRIEQVKEEMVLTICIIYCKSIILVSFNSVVKIMYCL